jgi:hypothetical protein
LARPVDGWGILPLGQTEGGMRIYEGSPRQDWEEVLRSIGAYADRERLKELLLLELDGGFLLQGLTLPPQGVASEGFGALAKRTHELTDEQIAELMEEAAQHRGSAADDQPHPDVEHYYELSMRVVGAYIDSQKAHDAFLFEQDGSYVVRLFGSTGTRAAGHQLAEFTRDEIMAMIESAPEHRQSAPEA